jgi:hypothetical protein
MIAWSSSSVMSLHTKVLHAELTDRCVLHVAVARTSVEQLMQRWTFDGIGVERVQGK